MNVKLTGKMSGKRVIVQPANIVSKGMIAKPGTTTSYNVFSPVWLVR